ncbi:MAG: transposase [Deltaproteobacteria bacterium]|nr:transposase [Deltaproteobacteria bacterium]
MSGELSEFLGRQAYERKENKTNHRNGKYDYKLSLKGIASVPVPVIIWVAENRRKLYYQVYTSLKMGIHRRSSPVGKVQRTCPYSDRSKNYEFTQLTLQCQGGSFLAGFNVS